MPSMVAYAVSPKPTAVGASTPTSSPLPCMVRSTLPSNGDPSVSQGKDFDSEKLVFGYSLIQLPTLETNYSWAFGSQLRAVSSLGHRTPNPRLTEDDAKRLNVPLQIHSSKGNGEPIMETGTSSSSRQKEIQLLRSKRSAIKPGVASNVEFGGCGSYPNLPGPKGKTILGVTYKFNKNQIKIVCACHGSNISPNEFIQHASADSVESKITQAQYHSPPCHVLSNQSRYILFFKNGKKKSVHGHISVCIFL